MSVRVKGSSLKAGTFHEAMKKISSYPYSNPWVTAKMAKKFKKIYERLDQIQKIYNEGTKAYAVTNADGEIEIDTKTGAVKILEGKDSEYQKFVTEFDAKEYLVDVEPFELHDLEKVGLTPNEMLMFEPFLDLEGGDFHEAKEKIEAEAKKEVVASMQ